MNFKDKTIIFSILNFLFNVFFLMSISKPTLLSRVSNNISTFWIELFFLVISIIFYSITIHLFIQSFSNKMEKLGLIILFMCIFNSIISLLVIIFLSGVLLGAFPA